MRLPPSSKMAMLFVKLFLRASASAAAPISLAAASVSDFFVVSSPMSPSVFGDGARRIAAERDHVQCMFGGLNRGRELIAVHAARLHAAFPLDRRFDEGVRLTARWNSNLVVEQSGQREPQLPFDRLQRLHECVVSAITRAGGLEFLIAEPDQN